MSVAALAKTFVAPFTGAWIETWNQGWMFLAKVVAPFTGAWIETRAPVCGCSAIRSHPSRVRGLKLGLAARLRSATRSHPSRVRGLKHDEIIFVELEVLSHPSRVRGLKHRLPAVHRVAGVSHPSRVRGLKHRAERRLQPRSRVAPFTGAWIETPTEPQSTDRNASHPSRVRGLKPSLPTDVGI